MLDYRGAYDALRNQRAKTDRSIENEEIEKAWLSRVKSIATGTLLILIGFALIFMSYILH